MRIEPRNLRGIGRWAAIGSWALVDQGVNSGAGFALNLLLAMWLSPADYGAFAVGFAIFLVIAGLHNALIIEPVSILGPSRHAAWLNRYLRRQVVLHFLLTIPAGATIALAGAVLQGRQATATVGRSLVGLGFALPLLLLFWTLRRFQYVSGTAAKAAAGAGAYAAALLGLILWGRWAGLLTPAIGLAAMGGAGLAASVVLRVPRGPFYEASSSGLRPLLAEQWRYGRWMIAAGLLTAVGMQLYTVIAAATMGLEAAGLLRAMEILMLPMALGITSIATLALPRLAADHGRGDLAGFSTKAATLSLALTAGAILYEVALVLWHHDLEQLIYGGRYAGESWLIPVMGLIPVLTAASVGFTLMLKAAQIPAHYLVNGLVSSIVGLPLTLLLGLRFDVAGFAWSLVLTHAAILIAVAVMHRRWIRPAIATTRRVVEEQGATP